MQCAGHRVINAATDCSQPLSTKNKSTRHHLTMGVLRGLFLDAANRGPARTAVVVHIRVAIEEV